MSNYIYVILVIVALTIAFIGGYYVHLAKNARKAISNKQLYVKENIKQFGANNRGTSMDKQKIFVVSPSDLGI